MSTRDPEAPDSLIPGQNWRFHDGTITLRNKETGVHRTLRIETRRGKHDPFIGKRTLGLLTGPSNTDDFEDFAFVEDHHDGRGWPRITVWRRHAESTRFMHPITFVMGVRYSSLDLRRSGAKEKLAALLCEVLSPPSIQGGTIGMRSTYDVLEERRCIRCGRKLTTPESIEDGIGPECAEKVAADRAARRIRE